MCAWRGGQELRCTPNELLICAMYEPRLEVGSKGKAEEDGQVCEGVGYWTVDLDRLSDDFLICATYDPRLEASGKGGTKRHWCTQSLSCCSTQH